MKTFLKFYAVLVVSAFFVSPVQVALAQNTIKADQGRPGNQGPWPVTISGSGTTVVVGPDGGAVITQDPPCVGGRETLFVPSTVDGGVCPSSALAGRRTITLCNAPKNILIASMPFMVTTIDGQAPNNTLYSPGQQLGLGDCISYTAGASIPVHCISDTFDAGLAITECK